MIIYHQSKVGSKRISSSADTAYFDHMSPCYDLDLENSNSIFLHVLQHMVMYHNTKFGLKKKCYAVQKIPSGQVVTFSHFTVTLTLKAVTIYLFLHKTLAYDDDQAKFGCRGINSSEDIKECHILIK